MGVWTGDDTRQITVDWKYEFPGKEVLAKWDKPRRTGFNISWYVEDRDRVQKSDLEANEEVWTSKLDMEPLFTSDTYAFVAFVNMAQQALDGKTDHKLMMQHLKEHILDYKLGFGGSRIGRYFCMFGQTQISFDSKVFPTFQAIFNFTYDTTIYKDVSKLALRNGFELFSTLLHCPSHKSMDLVLQEFLLSFQSPRALLQGTTNMINSGLGCHNLCRSADDFCEVKRSSLRFQGICF